MAAKIANEAEIRAVRDRLRSELSLLDRLGERMAAIELNSAIEILNDRLGEPTSKADLQQLQRENFSN